MGAFFLTRFYKNEIMAWKNVEGSSTWWNIGKAPAPLAEIILSLEFFCALRFIPWRSRELVL
jgi:hypothetical protein